MDYARLVWRPEDVQCLREDWSLEQCEEFLQRNERHIQDRLCEHGWIVIEALIAYEEGENA